MTPEMVELARYLITCKGWYWMPGMEVFPARFEKERWLVCWCDDDGREAGAYQTSGGKWWNIANNDTDLDLSKDWLPNLEDPATLGCLLYLVREAWKDPEAHLVLRPAGWVLHSGESRVATIVYPSLEGKTEVEALVNALGAAP